MSDLVGNPEARFSCVVAHKIGVNGWMPGLIFVCSRHNAIIVSFVV